MSEALRLADELDALMDEESLVGAVTIDRAAAELRRLHAELERKSDAIQRLWKERDELRSECRTLVRQNGEWQELTAELVEALRRLIDMDVAYRRGPVVEEAVEKARAALAKVEASK